MTSTEAARKHTGKRDGELTERVATELERITPMVKTLLAAELAAGRVSLEEIRRFTQDKDLACEVWATAKRIGRGSRRRAGGGTDKQPLVIIGCGDTAREIYGEDL